MAKNKQILLIGGGTGGHVVPVFELYKKLKSSEKRPHITIIGTGTEIELNFFSGNPDYKILKTGKFRRQVTLRNILELFFVISGLVRAYFLLRKIKPEVIFSKGGYVSVPIIYWAKKLHIPYFVHESDTEMGVANRYGATGAEKVFIGFPSATHKDVALAKVVYSGQIMRSDFIKDQSGKKEDFGFGNSLPVILVTGGSQGALNINKNIVRAAETLLQNYNIIHQTGGNDYQWVKKYRDSLAPENQEKYYVCDFLKSEEDCDRMTQAVNVSDLVIARAGANTISEMSAKEKAMILIPYKYAASDHQTTNAKILEGSGAAVVISDDSLSAKIIIEKVDELFSDKKKLQLLGRNAKNLFAEDGLSIVSKEILNKI